MRIPNVRLGFCSRFDYYSIGPSSFKSRATRLCYSLGDKMRSTISQSGSKMNNRLYPNGELKIDQLCS